MRRPIAELIGSGGYFKSIESAHGVSIRVWGRRVYLQLGAAEDSPGEGSLAEGSRPAEEGSPAGSTRCWPC